LFFKIQSKQINSNLLESRYLLNLYKFNQHVPIHKSNIIIKHTNHGQNSEECTKNEKKTNIDENS